MTLATSKYLPIYLNDHLAGSTLGVNLAHRIAKNNRDNDYGSVVEGIAREIEEDKRTLEAIMDRLGAAHDPVKMAGAWVGERLARFKLNGELLSMTYSPLSRFEELEMLTLGVTGKLAMWRALRAAVADDPRLPASELDELIGRAESQQERLEALRLRAAGEALRG